MIDTLFVSVKCYLKSKWIHLLLIILYYNLFFLVKQSSFRLHCVFFGWQIQKKYGEDEKPRTVINAMLDTLGVNFDITLKHSIHLSYIILYYIIIIILHRIHHGSHTLRSYCGGHNKKNAKCEIPPTWLSTQCLTHLL